MINPQTQRRNCGLITKRYHAIEYDTIIFNVMDQRNSAYPEYEAVINPAMCIWEDSKCAGRSLRT
jgi:hypothetical protein